MPTPPGLSTELVILWNSVIRDYCLGNKTLNLCCQSFFPSLHLRYGLSYTIISHCCEKSSISDLISMRVSMEVTMFALKNLDCDPPFSSRDIKRLKSDAKRVKKPIEPNPQLLAIQKTVRLSVSFIAT